MNDDINLMIDPATQLVTVSGAEPTISVVWDQAVQAAVIEERVGPTIASRAYAMTHTAIFDAWASYDLEAVATTVGDALQQDALAGTDANKAEAMSWAAYTTLVDLFPDQAAFFATIMQSLGYDPAVQAIAPDSPAALGREIGLALIEARSGDGANQAAGYADTTGYAPVNSGPSDIVDIARWTPENVPLDPEDGTPEQNFLTAQWGTVTPFGLTDGAALRPPAPEPFFVEGVEATLDIDSATITLGSGEVLAVTPDLVGTVINPAFVAQAEQVAGFSANLTDEQKLIAEFWEDAGGTSFPPGTWMTFGEFISARDGHDLDTDAQMFFALGNAVMNAGIATWEAKTFYDYVRPVRAIRELGELGLIGTPGTDALTGEQGFVIEAYGGDGVGTTTILAENFVTYQTPGSDASPPFAEYTSGHSAFSAAGAAVLRLFTESDAFGADVTFEPGSSRFEPSTTPAEAVTLAWESFTAAADEAGMSRLYGGIHFQDGDLNGRLLGREAGEAAFREAFRFIGGVGDSDDIGTADPAALAVGRLYEAFFGRVADAPGLNHWVDATAQLTDAQIVEAFLASAEFAASFPDGTPTGAALVDTLFLNLGLDPDTTDADEALTVQLAGRTPAGAAIADFVASDLVAGVTDYLAALEQGEDGSIWFV